MAAVALRTRLGHLWQQPRIRWLGLLAIVIAFSLSGFLLYLKYFRDEVFPEYYIAAPILVLILLGFLVIGYPWWSRWTGFWGYNKVSTATERTSTPQIKITRTEEHQPGKTLWDWLQLLIIPVILAAGALWFNYHQDQISHQIATDQQQEMTLENYLDKISELLTDKHLKEPKLGFESQAVARARTLTALQRLDPGRKGLLLSFLYEAGLVTGDPTGKTHPIIVLVGADLSKADLSKTNLLGADLSGANLSGADLSGTNLSGADLSRTNLSGADLINANLSKVLLRNAILSHANLSGDNLTYADLSGAHLDSAHLEYVVLSRAKLSLADLYGSILTATNLSSADLSDANLGFVNLDYSVLNHTNLTYADLNNACLVYANFSNANLIHVDFNHANLTDANLSHAVLDFGDISGAMITQKQLAQAASKKSLITERVPAMSYCSP